MSLLSEEVSKRCTFAIISHPDAGKTTLTEKFLLFGGAIQLAGTVKSRKSSRYATSDWMELEKQRGISVTTSVMQFPYKNRIINLLDTPGHADFSEDTYRTLTAVDSALMVIDGAKGVEERTIKLLEICRLRQTPIFTFINKLDRNSRPPIDLLDEIERILNIRCAPISWPIGMGQQFRGIYHLAQDAVIFYDSHKGDKTPETQSLKNIMNPALDVLLGEQAIELREEIELVKGASHAWDNNAFLNGQLTPVFFGSGLNNFGVKELLDNFVLHAPSPLPRVAEQRTVFPEENRLTGFVFKIQANMDPAHHDRIAFMRVCSGHYEKGKRMRHVRIGRDIQVNQAVTFMAGERSQAEEAWPGDIIGLHNHGTIQVGDTFTEGENLRFMGIPHFAPELFRLVRLKDPLKMKALQKGLTQLSEEGATQIFRPVFNNDLILGAVGLLQFDVVAYRLKQEYGVDCSYENVNVYTARWICSSDEKALKLFEEKAFEHLARDGSHALVYLAPTRINLRLMQERWQTIHFRETREI